MLGFDQSVMSSVKENKDFFVPVMVESNSE